MGFIKITQIVILKKCFLYIVLFFNVGLPVATPLDCPVGRYCTIGTIVPDLCPAGTYGPNENAVQLENCTSCTPGMYCGVEGLDAPSGNCSAGFYCTGGADVADPADHLVSRNFRKY